MDTRCVALKKQGSDVFLTLLFECGKEHLDKAPLLTVRDEKTQVCVDLEPEDLGDDKAVWRLELGYAGNLACFCSGKMGFYVEGEPVVATKDQVKGLSVTADHYTNAFSVSEGEQLFLKVKMAWGKREDTKEKRVANEKRLYKLFRHIFPLKKNKVLFESFSKRTFSDNPKAIYQELVARDAGYECVWSLVNAKTDVGRGGKVTRFESIEYWYHMATAKYIVSNFNQYRLKKRKGQVVVNTMHGVPLKHMGLSVAKQPSTIENMKRTFASWDYFVTPCDYMSDILTGPHYGFKGEFICAGYPRNDVVIAGGKDAQMRERVRAALGVPAGKKVILWVPTWRTKKRFDLALDLDRMREALGDEYVLVLRSHYLESKYVPASVYNDFVLNGHAYENVGEMMFAADVLITDYSSIMFDFSLLERPMVFFTWDYDNYMNEARGMYFDLRAEFPSLIAATTEEVIEKFSDFDALSGDLARFHDKFNQYDEGDAAAKVCDKLWPDSRKAASK